MVDTLLKGHIKTASVDTEDSKENIESIQYVIMWGDFENGYELIGPFDGPDAAVKYADEYMNDADWDIIMLQKPAESSMIGYVGDIGS